MSERFLRSVRLLAECFQAFEHRSGRHVRELGLTSPQFDIVATLGRTPGMTFKQLGEATLITKGTLTGVVDRLQARGLVIREPSAVDGRSTLVKLTEQGNQLFETVFPAHVDYLKSCFARYQDADLDRLDAELDRLRKTLRDGPVKPAVKSGT